MQIIGFSEQALSLKKNDKASIALFLACFFCTGFFYVIQIFFLQKVALKIYFLLHQFITEMFSVENMEG